MPNGQGPYTYQQQWPIPSISSNYASGKKRGDGGGDGGSNSGGSGEDDEPGPTEDYVHDVICGGWLTSTPIALMEPSALASYMVSMTLLCTSHSSWPLSLALPLY